MLRTCCLLSIIAVALSYAAQCQAAEAELLVELASGRQFHGMLDPASTDSDLVLRSGTPRMTIRRPIRWERIVQATLDGQPVEIAALKERAAQLAAELPPPARPSLPPREPLATALVSTEQIPSPSPPAVVSIAFDARIANWDADVETDGLLVDLYPLAADGFLAPAGGTVEIELFASQRRVFHHAPLSGGDTIELVERWTRSIDAADFTTRGAQLKLPFGAVHPEFDSDWLAHYYGLVHVRFAAPGHGVFEASQDAIRIRPYAPLRDRLELYGGRRFLPTERTGRGANASANSP